MHTLYTYGYTGTKVDTLIKGIQARGALLVDTRYRPYSRNHVWNKKALTLQLIQQYVHLEALGNVNYKNGGEIVIADAAAGVPFVVRRLDVQPVVLLCACPDVTTCHRHVIANLVQAAAGCSVVHLTPQDMQAWADSVPPRQLPLF
jgi:uncharacterized protein (DUF488 family)